MFADNPKILKLLVIGIFAVVVPLSIIGINMFEKNVTNPRIWENWTCDEMEKFASVSPMKLTFEKPVIIMPGDVCVLLKPESNTVRIIGSGTIQ